MNRSSLAVIGVGNMAKAIISGINSTEPKPISDIVLFDINTEQYSSVLCDNVSSADTAANAVERSDVVLISVKPQNYSEILSEIKSASGYQNKLYISIGAGISTDFIKEELGEVSVVRVLPNLPMVIGKGVSAVCRNDTVSDDDFLLVERIFSSAGSIVLIDECEMNRIIGVTSSSPAYVFKFIDAICKGAEAQGISSDSLLDVVCDMVIGATLLLKESDLSAKELISRVASKGGTTERALSSLEADGFDTMIADAMIACTARADELGKAK